MEPSGESQPIDNRPHLNLRQVDLEPLSGKPIRDYSRFWELPFLVSQAAFQLNTTTEKGFPGYATDSDGRAFTLPRMVFKFKGGKSEDAVASLPYPLLTKLGLNLELPPVVFNDYQEKGGGAHAGLVPAEMQRAAEPGRRVTFFPRSELGRTDEGPPAGGFYDTLELDEAFSFLFHSWGGRTRLPIACFPVTSVSMPEGIMTTEEAKKKGLIDQDLVSSHWGIRSRWRLDDMVSIFLGEQFKSTSAQASLMTEPAPIHPQVEHFGQNKNPSEEVLQAGEKFAKEVTSRAQNDTDSRWRNLAQKYAELPREKLSDFYLEYLNLLAKTIGEGMGHLYKKEIYLYQFNFQNFTALGEIVDFDVALYKARYFIDGSTLPVDDMVKNDMLSAEEAAEGVLPNEPGLQAENVFATLQEFATLYLAFRNSGLITVEGSLLQRSFDQSLKDFASGFMSTGFSHSPGAVVRNNTFIGYLEKAFLQDEYWDDYANPMIESLSGANKILYGYHGRYKGRTATFRYFNKSDR